jgi:amino acid permease
LYPNIASLLKVLGADINPSDFTPTFSHFSSIYCGIILGIVLFPLLIMKKVNFLIKINSYGVYFVSILIGFVFYQGIHSLFTQKFDFEYIENKNAPDTQVRHLYLFGENPSMLAGALTMGYFSHSFVLSMMQNNEKQENNKRDLFFGYCLVCFTYVLIGLLGYIGFSEIQFDAIFKDVKLK